MFGYFFVLCCCCWFFSSSLFLFLSPFGDRKSAINMGIQEAYIKRHERWANKYVFQLSNTLLQDEIAAFDVEKNPMGGVTFNVDDIYRLVYILLLLFFPCDNVHWTVTKSFNKVTMKIDREKENAKSFYYVIIFLGTIHRKSCWWRNRFSFRHRFSIPV